MDVPEGFCIKIGLFDLQKKRLPSITYEVIHNPMKKLFIMNVREFL